MNRIVPGLCCVLVIGVAGAAARSGVVMIADADSSAQGTAHVTVEAQVQSNVRSQVDASTSAGITANASAAPELAGRMRRLESSFRCLVCQNETIADSTADLAADLRLIIHEQVQQGATDAQIRDYMVTRYGDFVLYDPPFKTLTWVLWLGPFALLALGLGVFAGIVLQRRKMMPPKLTDLQQQRARRLLGNRT
ncbi:cytochrome c-type biogenesis protein [Caballeronia sordidicola]|uniref:cytochrome c-type biogenesis protein n=1 Tax=Caballeronia sordidicola TaxID=196367 RepID=UPI001F3C4635|nr:cytochrome c-type biogenesis protein [Caballeronia sordidicola]